MRQDSKANNIIRDIVILTDFIVLNILFCLWFQYDRQGAQLSHSVSVLLPTSAWLCPSISIPP